MLSVMNGSNNHENTSAKANLRWNYKINIYFFKEINGSNYNLLCELHLATNNIAHPDRYNIERHIQIAKHKSSVFVENC